MNRKDCHIRVNIESSQTSKVVIEDVLGLLMLQLDGPKMMLIGEVQDLLFLILRR